MSTTWGDVVREATATGVDDGGTDLVNSSVSYVLGSFVEKLSLTGGDAIDGTGNGLDNVITGNSGVNHLYGGGGDDKLSGGGDADILDGGEGNDNYTVDGTDVVHDNGRSTCRPGWTTRSSAFSC